MDSKEVITYFETAEEQLADAELAFRENRCSLCVFLSASSAENATSALIIAIGAKPSKKHRNSLVLNKLLPSLPLKVRLNIKKIIESIKFLEPHIIKARCPIRIGLELYPPSKFYTKEIAEKAFTNARNIMEMVKRLLRVIGT